MSSLNGLRKPKYFVPTVFPLPAQNCARKKDVKRVDVPLWLLLSTWRVEPVYSSWHKWYWGWVKFRGETWRHFLKQSCIYSNWPFFSYMAAILNFIVLKRMLWVNLVCKRTHGLYINLVLVQSFQALVFLLPVSLVNYSNFWNQIYTHNMLTIAPWPSNNILLTTKEFKMATTLIKWSTAYTSEHIWNSR